MKTRKSIVLITIAVVVAALVITGSAIALLQTSNTSSVSSNQAPAINPTSSPGLTINQAATAAQNYLSQIGNPNLAIKDVQEYSNVFCVQVVEKDTGAGAFELAVNKDTGAVTPMQGPTMMWNTKYGLTSNGMMGYLTSGTSSYGMMGESGMMHWLRGTPTTNMVVNMEQAKTGAQQYLNTNYPGTTVGQVTAFYGYYAMQVIRNGNIVGVISVDGANGRVMYYSWCGSFMQQLRFS